MEIEEIKGATHVFSSPPDWDKTKDSVCMGLPIREVVTEQGSFYVSSWRPSEEELKALNAGDTIKLWVRGPGHPVVALTVGELSEG